MDELMMGWLYDELDPSSSARVAQHIGACARCSAEVGALRRTREAFRDLSELDAPPSVSAILLHEAAVRAAPAAAAMGAGPAGAASVSGAWTRLRSWLRPLALHPTATALATLVLVAGVAGALHVRGRFEAARSEEPTSAPHEPAPRDPAFATEPEPARSATASPAEPAPAEQASGAQAEGRPAGPDGEAEKKAVARTDRDDDKGDLARARGDDRSPPKPAPKQTREPRAPPADRRSADPSASASRGGPGLGGVPESGALDGIERAGGGSAATSPAAPAGAPPARPDPIADADESAGGRSRPEGDQPLSRKEQGWLESQEAKLGALARSKRCREAAAIANDILDRNPDYFARRVKDSRAVQPCQSYVSDERQRRSARRAQKAPPSTSKSGASGSQKARAAPERNQAAEQKKQ